MKKLSEKQKIIQEQAKIYGSYKGAEGGKKREQEYELDQQNRALDAAACDDFKKTLRVVKRGIGFHNFRHNKIQILNFNIKILATHFFLFVECLIVFLAINVVE